MEKNIVFLGGTVDGYDWRGELIPKLSCDYVNPIVDDWNEECIKNEYKMRDECTILLYTITYDMRGVYSIAEVVDDSNKRPEKTIFCLLEAGFTPSRLKSLLATVDLLKNNGVKCFSSLDDVSTYINNYNEER